MLVRTLPLRANILDEVPNLIFLSLQGPEFIQTWLLFTIIKPEFKVCAAERHQLVSSITKEANEWVWSFFECKTTPITSSLLSQAVTLVVA
jgi:hypothetical protein